MRKKCWFPFTINSVSIVGDFFCVHMNARSVQLVYIDGLDLNALFGWSLDGLKFFFAPLYETIIIIYSSSLFRAYTYTLAFCQCVFPHQSNGSGLVCVSNFQFIMRFDNHKKKFSIRKSICYSYRSAIEQIQHKAKTRIKPSKLFDHFTPSYARSRIWEQKYIDKQWTDSSMTHQWYHSK